MLKSSAARLLCLTTSRRRDVIEEDKVLGLLGLASKAGSVALGKDAIRTYLRGRRRNKAIVVASNASSSVKLDWAKRCSHHGATAVFLMKTDKTRLGNAIGKKNVSAVAITDEKLADRILQLAVPERRENR